MSDGNLGRDTENRLRALGGHSKIVCLVQKHCQNTVSKTHAERVPSPLVDSNRSISCADTTAEVKRDSEVTTKDKDVDEIFRKSADAKDRSRRSRGEKSKRKRVICRRQRRRQTNACGATSLKLKCGRF